LEANVLEISIFCLLFVSFWQSFLSFLGPQKGYTFLVAVVAFAAFVALAPFTKWRVLIYSNQGSFNPHAPICVGCWGVFFLWVARFTGHYY